MREGKNTSNSRLYPVSGLSSPASLLELMMSSSFYLYVKKTVHISYEIKTKNNKLPETKRPQPSRGVSVVRIFPSTGIAAPIGSRDTFL